MIGFCSGKPACPDICTFVAQVALNMFSLDWDFHNKVLASFSCLLWKLRRPMKKNIKVLLQRNWHSEGFCHHETNLYFFAWSLNLLSSAKPLQEAIQVLFSSLPSTKESLEVDLMEASLLLLTRMGGQVVKFLQWWVARWKSSYNFHLVPMEQQACKPRS